MKKLKIGILSTINTNIGDEFIRDGILCILESILGSKDEFECVVYNKHKPWTFYPSFHPIRIGQLLDATLHRGWKKIVIMLSALPGNRFRAKDLIIQSGTPIIWNGCSQSEWATPFWKNIVFKNKRGTPILNIGGGACYPWSNPPEVLSGKDRDFASLMVTKCNLTTCRDTLASRLLSDAANTKIEVIECPGFLAGLAHTAAKPTDGRILINAMPIGGHFDYMNQVDPNEWLDLLTKNIQNLQKDFKIEFVCHDKKEVNFVSNFWPSYTIHFPKTPSEYFRICAGAHAAIVNRLHAAVGLSGLGIPCIAIGTDTRLLMTKEIGITSLFLPELTYENLNIEIKSLLSNRDSRSEILLSKRETVFEKYRSLLQPFMENIIK